jgi:geranylgeranyl pyrophosphate synthase
MVGGQVDDLACTGMAFDAVSKEIEEATLTSIHKRKTGALIRFSLWSGAKLVAADEHQLMDLARFGDILGLAFQITDDLLDVTGDINTLGKTPGKDEASDKATWVRLFGIEGSKKRLSELQDEGEGLLSGMRLANSSVLNELLQYAIHRIN